jgi:hypothetical protein
MPHSKACLRLAKSANRQNPRCLTRHTALPTPQASQTQPLLNNRMGLIFKSYTHRIDVSN